MASRIYCSDVALELKCLSEKLHKLSFEIDRVPSIDKYKLTPQIQGLRIIMTELDDHLCDLMSACDTVEELSLQGRDDVKLPTSFKLNRNQDEFFDYDFGG
jgi:hypothetical protein